MSVLLLAEHDHQSLSEQTAKALTAALQVDDDVDILVVGSCVDGIAQEAAKLSAVKKVLICDDPLYAHGLAEPLGALLVSLMVDYDGLIAPATTYGKNVLPRVAALLDVMQISDIIEVISHDTFKRPIYAGNALQTVQSTDDKKVITVRTASFKAQKEDGDAEIETIQAKSDPGHSSFVSEALAQSERPDLAAAKVVVSGGRALGSKEKFDALMLPLADALEGAIGASRAAVDAGYAPNDWQVGQTGKIVAPDLYIAIGISGAIQHLAGMKDSRIIVAINKDEDAPIFQSADYGLVGDLFDIVPEMLEKLKQ